MVEFYPENNFLSGELPRFGWAHMKALRSFDVSSNDLIGMIPEELCSLPLESLVLHTNNHNLEGATLLIYSN